MMDIIPQGATVVTITENTVDRRTAGAPMFLSTVIDRADVVLVVVEGKIFEHKTGDATSQAEENPGSPYAPLAAA